MSPAGAPRPQARGRSRPRSSRPGSSRGRPRSRSPPRPRTPGEAAGRRRPAPERSPGRSAARSRTDAGSAPPAGPTGRPSAGCSHRAAAPSTPWHRTDPGAWSPVAAAAGWARARNGSARAGRPIAGSTARVRYDTGPSGGHAAIHPSRSGPHSPMTIRVRPADRGRTSRDPNRRTFYMNLAFGITVVVAILILVIVGATTWYNAHLAAAATVDGQTITKDQFIERARVEQFRLNQLANRVKADVSAGRLTSAEGQSRITAINNELDDSQGAFSGTIIEKPIDTPLQQKLPACV